MFMNEKLLNQVFKSLQWKIVWKATIFLLKVLLILAKTLKFSWSFIWISSFFKQTENNHLFPSPLMFLQWPIMFGEEWLDPHGVGNLPHVLKIKY